MRNPLSPRVIFLWLLVSLLSSGFAHSKSWTAHPIEVNDRVKEIIQDSKTSVLVKIGKVWKRAQRCTDGVCLTDAEAPQIVRAPKGGMADGGLAVHDGQGIVSAWYTQPTQRYHHGVLGNDIEGGALSVKDHAGKLHTYTLSKDSVFEDLTPRLVDLDGDGKAEVITIRSYLKKGASIAVFGLRDGKLSLVAFTPPYGRPYRWLNVAGIDDFNGDGSKDIAFVVTPHIGGILQIWSYDGKRLTKIASRTGFSNHFSGERTLGLSAVGDADGDGIVDIAVPNATRYSFRIMHLNNGSLEELARVGLRAAIALNIGILPPEDKGDTPIYILGLRHGALIAVSY